VSHQLRLEEERRRAFEEERRRLLLGLVSWSELNGAKEASVGEFNAAIAHTMNVPHNSASAAKAPHKNLPLPQPTLARAAAGLATSAPLWDSVARGSVTPCHSMEGLL